MRNLLLFSLLFTLLIPQAKSQINSITLSGTVQDASNAAIPGHRIFYWASDVTTSFNKLGTVYTDANGQYADTIQYPTSNNLKIRVSYDSCGRSRQRRYNNVTTNIILNLIVCPPPCRAIFSYRRDTSGLVHFGALDTSFTSYSWNFGNGYTTTGHHASHQFASSGRYPVCLAIANGSCTDTFCLNINVLILPPPPSCRATFIYRPDTAGIVHFQALDTTYGGYTWNFGNGYTVTGHQASYQFPSTGMYPVCLAIAQGNCVDTTCRTIPVSRPVPPPPSCRAVFTYRRDTMGLVHVQAWDTTFTSYSWDFGAGYTTGGHQASYQFSTNGRQTICLATANGSCTDTFCLNVNIYIPPPPPARCKTNFVIRRDTSGLYHFQAIDTSFTSYSWDFGSGFSATGHQVSNQFTNGGTVKVCLATANGSCVDTVCRFFRVIIMAPRCRAVFRYRRDTTGAVHFQALDTSYSTYSWHFGDGSTASGHNPTHSYTSSGHYKVCLVTQNGACMDSFCQDVFVRLPGQIKLFGRVYKDRNFAQDYEVFLVVHDSAAGTLTAIDTFRGSRRHFGGFYFWAPPGDYLVKAALTQADSNYAQYLPTYYGDSLLWSDATVVSPPARPYVRINLVPGVNPGGPGFTGGLISQGANRQGNISASGDFQASTTQRENQSLTTAITDLPEGNQPIKVYPNPAQDKLFVSLELQQSGVFEMTLCNALGQRVANDTRHLASGKQEVAWMFDVPAGVYLLQLTLDGKPLSVQRIIFR